MRMFRLSLYFCVGLLLGTWSVFSFAVTFTNTSGPSMIQRAGNGSISGVNLPASSSSTPAGIQASAMNGLLSLTESGKWELLDPSGKTISVPGNQSVTLSGARLAKLAGSAASLLKGGIQGAIIQHLLAEGIRLVNDEWEKDRNKPNNPMLLYQYPVGNGTYAWTDNYAFAAAQVCVASQAPYIYTGYTQGAKYGINSGNIATTCEGKSSSGQNVGTYLRTSVNFDTRCPNGSVPVNGSCGEITETVPATEEDLQNALDNRRKMMDSALKDYYDALAANSQRVKLQDLAMDPSSKYQASGTPTQGQPVTQTTTNPDGSTVTRTETPTYTVQSNGDTYNNNQVTINNTTVITNNETNNNVTNTTTTTEQREQQDYSFVDSSLPAVPDLYTPKYPDGLAGVWNDKISTIKSSSLFSFVNELSAGAPSSGSCPSWNISLAGIGKLGSYTLQPPCIVWPFVRWALLITALFVSRRLVFGG